MSTDTYGAGYAAADQHHKRVLRDAQAALEDARQVIDRVEALSWEMSPEQGRKLREVIGRQQ